MAVGNTIALQSATFLRDGNETGDSFKAYNDVLTPNEWDLLYHELEHSITFVLGKSKFKNIFDLKSLQVGEYNVVTFIYRAPSDSLDFYMTDLIKDLDDETEMVKIITHEGHTIMTGKLQPVDEKVGESTYIVRYNETHTIGEDGEYDITFDKLEITLGPDATVKNLVDAFAAKTGYSRKDYSFKVFNTFDSEIKGFQKKLRTCCFDLEVELRMSVKDKSRKSPKSPRRSPRKSKSPRRSPRRSKSPKSPRNKPVDNPTFVDINRLYSGRSTKKSDIYSVKEIRAFLKERGLKQVGNKEDLVERLRNNL